jgi:hypothetical protein
VNKEDDEMGTQPEITHSSWFGGRPQAGAAVKLLALLAVTVAGAWRSSPPTRARTS